MSAAYIEPRPVRRIKPVQPAIQLDPLGVNVIGTQPLLSVVLDMGADQPAYIIRLDTVQQAYVAKRITEKLPRSTA